MTILTRTILARSRSQQLALEQRAEWHRQLDSLPQPLCQIAYLLVEGWSEREIAVLLNKTRGFIARSRVHLLKTPILH